MSDFVGDSPREKRDHKGSLFFFYVCLFVYLFVCLLLFFCTTGRGTVSIEESSTDRLTPGQVMAHPRQ